ncbi:type II secretion system F family protein [Streptomyces xiamenensis]|uniref:type II secretion system F family protein n=1 Tax=Streptomyces xiamenensis TaxID=408015 RepID=UPI0035DD1808
MLAIACVLAVVGAVAGARGWRPGRGAAERGRGAARRLVGQLPPQWRGRYRPLLAGAGGVGIAVWMFTGWPVHGFVAAAAVAGFPFVWNPGGAAPVRIRRLEALAEWLNQLASITAAGLSLEEAVRGSTGRAPAGIRDHVQVLAARLSGGWPPHDAFGGLAHDMADGSVDHVVMLLQTHARDRGPGLTRTLESLATSMQGEAGDARAVEADRAKVRTSARWISVFVLGVVGVCMVNEDYMAPYASPLGQAALLALVGAFAALLVLMHRMARTPPPPRLLNTTADLSATRSAL